MTLDRLDDPTFQQGSRQAEQLERAKVELAEDGKDIAPGRVGAALTFRYRTAFFGADYEDLWRETLKQIARREDGKLLARKNFSRSLTPTRILRNRVAHHEPILSWNLPKHYDNMIQITEWLSPDAAQWCRTHCRIPSIWPAEGIQLAISPETDAADSSTTPTAGLA